MAVSASLPVRHAVLLGLVQGPTELLPVSSSGHAALLPAVLGWPLDELRPDHRKAFEVALHAGSAAGILVAARRAGIPLMVARETVATGVMTAPAMLCGLLLGSRIEERLGGAASVAAAQVAAGAALWASDLLPARRRAAELRLGDALLLGAGQAAALMPGVSRAGAVLTTSRALGFRRPDAAALAWRAALPVLAGATALKVARLAIEGLPGELRAPFAAGAGAAFASTVASAPLARVPASGASFAPFAAYRIAVGAGTLLAMRRRQERAR